MSDDATVCAKCGAPRGDGDDDRVRCRFCGARHPVEAARDLPNGKAGGASAALLGVFVFVAAFGVLWTIAAASIGAPLPFALFGLLFSGFALYLGNLVRRARAATTSSRSRDERVGRDR